MDKNQIRGIYNRALYLNQRREMLRWWSNYIEDAYFGDCDRSFRFIPIT
ncbi:hypothetical protein VAEKB19_4050160 [Vibrio aestuarianus]|nr:hypothetical protein VAEKB19_4050160 [Vibrio aestuarianus]